MATADYWDEADMKALTFGGLVNEDVMQDIWNISAVPLPFTDLVGAGTSKQSYTEWTLDSLASPDTTNAIVSGSDASGNQAAGGTRVGNHHQISDKQLQVTDRNINTDTIGRKNEMAYQLKMRQRELKRDIEAIVLMPQASIADNGDAQAGKVGTFPAWLETNALRGASAGADGGFNTSTGVVDIPTAGLARVLTEAYIKTSLLNVYTEGGNVTTLMSTPPLIAGLATYLYAATTVANIDAVESDKARARVAQGAISIYKGQFGVVELVANRLQQTYASEDPEQVVNVFFIDPELAELTYLHKPKAVPLAKVGTADKMQITADWSLRVFQEKGHAVVADIQPAGTVTA